MIKVTGCILIILSCSLIGWMKGNSYKERTIELENIIEMIKLIELYITYRKEPLIKAFDKVSTTKKCWFSNVLKDCKYYMDNKLELDDSLKKAIDDHIGSTPLNEEDILVLEDLTMGLGKSDSESQRRILEPILIRLNNNQNSARYRESSMGKMYKTLGTAIGIVISILII